MMRYQIDIPTLMDFFCQGEHHGFSEEDIQASERAIGAPLPACYRDFLKRYGLDPINRRHNSINYPPEEIVTSYSCIQLALEDWEEEFQEAKKCGQENRYRDNGYFALWQLPQEKWPTVTENYVLLWYENQGVWSAGYRLSDLQDGSADPPLYISTNDDYITYAKYTDGVDEFLLNMLWSAAYGYNDGLRLTDSVSIDTVLSRAAIDRKCLEWRGQLSVCFDEEGKTLYFLYKEGEYQELRIAYRDKPTPQTLSSIESLPRPKYVPRKPCHIELIGGQKEKPADGLHIHPLIAWVVEQMHGERLLVPYDWMKAMGKMKGLVLNLKDVTVEPDGTGHVPLPVNLPSSFYLDTADWSILEKMPNLRTLRIENLIVDDFSFLPKCKNVQVLSLYNTNFRDCRLLLELPKLKEADLRFCPLEHKEVLQSLHVRWI